MVGIYKKKYSLLWWYTLVGFVANLLVAIIFYGSPARFPVANTYIIAEFILLFFFFKQQFNTKFQKASFIVLPFFCIGLANIFYTTEAGISLQHYKDFDAFSAAMFSLSYILLCILGYVKILQEKSTLHIERSAFFWANTAIFIYTSGIFFLFLFTRYLLTHEMSTYVGQLWQINDTLLILKSVMLSTSFFCKRP
ncbi:MAG: hypothetical protein R2800_15090 [Flavipsychrobacter sp.]